MRSKQWYGDYAQHFWSKVDKREPHECWLFPVKGKRRYGSVTYQNKPWGAHQMAYFLTHGEIPSGKLVCHTCDTPRCCNPAHLFIGTPRDNTQDCIKKGRKVVSVGADNGMFGVNGEQHPSSKFTDAEVLKIRELRRTGACNTIELAALYGVTQGAISAIVQGRVWKHVPVGEVKDFKNGAGNPNTKLTQALVDQMRKRHETGEMQKDLAVEFGIHISTVQRIIQRKTWS